MKKSTLTISILVISSLISGCTTALKSKAPDGLMIEFLQGPSVVDIKDPTPEFGWIVHSSHKNDRQTTYYILVSSTPKMLTENKADMWDSKKCDSANSINVPYSGKALLSNQTYYWKVKTWCRFGGESSWSDIMEFTTGNIDDKYVTTRHPLKQTEIAPTSIVKKDNGHYLIDFGKVAFGYLQLDLNAPDQRQMEVHFGERGNAEGIITDLGRTSVRYYKVAQPLKKGLNKLEIHPPVDKRNTGGKAIRLPEEFGIVTPFRYVELVNCPVQLKESMIRQVSIHYPFDESASAFESSDEVLNDIWALCKYSMKATSFCGIYVDGDRERIPYEADAYINQLSHYAVDREYSLARYSHEYLLEHPTWPIEWSQHSVLMAWADFMYTGNAESLIQSYDVLKKQKTQEFRARADGLLNTGKHSERGHPRVVLDWPRTERDGYEFKEVNTVVNAFYYKTLLQMADIAAVLGRESDAAEYRNKAANVKAVFNKVFFDTQRGLYVDGEGAEHISLHANMMPLAFGLVPEDRKKSVTDFVVSKGMACSVYGAQYLMEALYEGGRADVALERMTSKDIRSWYNMLRVGSTITLEAWDDKFKPNQDWNHAWGAVPGNIIPRYLMGVRPLEPGFGKVLIQPQPGTLKQASTTIPTIRGNVKVSFKNDPAKPFELSIDIPANMTARVGLPQGDKQSRTLIVDGKKVKAEVQGGYLFVDGVGSGVHTFKAKRRAPAGDTYDVAAFYWPSLHFDERWATFFPDGSQGEWESIRNCKPKWEGHYQPRVPAWGYLMDNDPKAMEKKIDAATSHGVNVMIFDWYWFENKPFLESALNDGFLKAKNVDKMKFYLMWANHDANTAWDIRRSHERIVIWPGSVDLPTFKTIVARVIKQYFSHPSYYKIDGKPVFSIYDMNNLIKGLGGVKQTVDALDYFRAQVKKAGFPDLHIQMIYWGQVPKIDDSGFASAKGTVANTIKTFQIDSLTNYQFVHLARPEADYVKWADKALSNWPKWSKEFDVPYFPHVSVGWDNNARFVHKMEAVTDNVNPETFKKYLVKAKAYADAHPDQPKLITINAWNEWVEGSYLEPDERFGMKYLEAVRDVFVLPENAHDAKADDKPADDILFLDKPAASWEKEAFPLGNGRLGCMVFGGVEKEHIQFNEDTVWIGDENDTGAYQAFGDMYIELAGSSKQTSVPASYKRELNIDKSLHTISYEKDGVNFRREYFASHPANVLVFRLTADKKRAYTGTISVTDAHKGAVKSENNKIMFSGALTGKYRKPTENYAISLKYEAQILVMNDGGSLETADGRISFKDCDSLIIMLDGGTDYLNKREKGWKKEHPHKDICQRLAKASKRSFDDLLKEHIEDYQALFNRVTVNLGETSEEILKLSTPERLNAYRGRKAKKQEDVVYEQPALNLKEGASDPDFEELLFQYARYLMISSSRPGCMPANLQGLWNDSNNPPWRSDYHTDVNIEMNYWFVDQANLSECFSPLAEWVNSIRQVRKDETKAAFNTRGWITHAENGIFGGSTWKWSKGDAAWVGQNLWDHYAFTLDKKYLRRLAYPIMKELCEFWVDDLKQLPDGTLVSPNGFSPEHGPHEDGVSFDQQLVWDLFTNFIEASLALGEDEAFRKKIALMKAGLLGPKIGKWGQLQEWMVDRDDPDNHHRHLSHLIAVHPGRQISPLTTPKFAQAAKVSMNARGDGTTGWSKAWKINIWARLHDGNRAYKLLSEQIRGNYYSNLFGYHPPFQIDGNFGYASGLCEMLMQSHMGQIHLLPALPDAWATGSVKGLRARGGFEVDIQWAGGELVSATIHSRPGTDCIVRYKGKKLALNIKKGKKVELVIKDLQ